MQELFTHDGSGTLVANDSYEQAREANIDDVGGILELIEPLEQQGVLVKRSRELLETEIRQFRLLVRDDRIIACAALYPFAEEACGEIACIVSHPDYRGGQRGQRLLEELEAGGPAPGAGPRVRAHHTDRALVHRAGLRRGQPRCAARAETGAV